MTTSVFEHPWLKGLFGDAQMAAVLAPERQLAHMLAFEAAWSRACGAAGLFDADDAAQAAEAIENATIDPAILERGMASDGVPVPALVQHLKTIAPANAVHKGATSQDVVDTALVLSLREASILISDRLEELERHLRDLEVRFGDNNMMGRTRMQAATTMAVRERVLEWRLPIADHLITLNQKRRDVEKVQIGGASGDRKALGDKAAAVVDHVAKELDLAATDKAWHAMRHGIAGYASFLSLITGTLGKMGLDVTLMAQQGIDEIALSGGGGSSAMPHKQNPISAELLVTLARFNAVQVSAMHHAVIHEQERSGTAWTLEWMVLPQMLMTTARALSVAIDMTQKIDRIGTR
ncbi:3-carboxy-cis,cis-muconate cycloisomerase [Celeribacter arenosi]|uniref:3-carboxy-cis,cis-muconate cycloisomerase n=1 Tax=Celeribacter arenosi TaxID=792649 RepID=A0ABP7KIS4_9RHOB